jgi:GNAT superfamily N-acetyltransferase
MTAKKPKKRSRPPQLAIRPVTAARWDDLEKLFGPRGACGGCWCMYWRLRRSEFDKKKGPGNKRALKRLVGEGSVPGLLAYAGKEPIGWVSLAPREEFPVLENSRVAARVDSKPVWSVVCLFIAREHRNRGVSVALLRAAADYAKKKGGRIVEGYPVEPKQDPMPDVFAYTGLASAFRRAGYREVARRTPTRPVMRRALRPR